MDIAELDNEEDESDEDNDDEVVFGAAGEIGCLDNLLNRFPGGLDTVYANFPDRQLRPAITKLNPSSYLTSLSSGLAPTNGCLDCDAFFWKSFVRTLLNSAFKLYLWATNECTSIVLVVLTMHRIS